MPEKQMKPPCNNCRLKCTSKISKEERQKLFSSFWTLESYERQNDFVCSNVTERKIRIYLDENESTQTKKRMVVRTYNLESGGQVHNVCKKFFMATLCVGDAYVSHAIKMKLNGRFNGNENLGKHTPHNKTEQTKLLRIREHIESFPQVAKIVSEYDQEIPQSRTADNPMAPRGKAAQPPGDTRKTNKAKQPALSSPSR